MSMWAWIGRLGKKGPSTGCAHRWATWTADDRSSKILVCADCGLIEISSR